MSPALDRLTVLDLATFVAAPFRSTLLGEFGAEVIKVEHPGFGDNLRQLGRPPAPGLSCWWLAESRDKKSVTCNLRTEEGQELIKQLIAQADILLGRAEVLGRDPSGRGGDCWRRISRTSSV